MSFRLELLALARFPRLRAPWWPCLPSTVPTTQGQDAPHALLIHCTACRAPSPSVNIRITRSFIVDWPVLCAEGNHDVHDVHTATFLAYANDIRLLQTASSAGHWPNLARQALQLPCCTTSRVSSVFRAATSSGFTHGEWVAEWASLALALARPGTDESHGLTVIIKRITHHALFL